MDIRLTRNQRTHERDLAVDETIFSQANGILGVRGSFAEGYGNRNDDPYALINGFYNFYPFRYEENSIHFPQQGQTIVKLPDATMIQILTEDGPIDLTHCELTQLSREYNLSKGLVERKAEYTTKKGYHFTICEERIVSQKNKSLLAIKLSVKSIDYTGEIDFCSWIQMPMVKEIDHHDPRVAQQKQHLNLSDMKIEGNCAVLSVSTTLSGLGAEIGVIHDKKFAFRMTDLGIIGKYSTQIKADESIEIVKKVIYRTDFTPSHSQSVFFDLKDLGSYEDIRKEQVRWASDFWKKNNTHLSQPDADLALKYSIYQLNCSGGESELSQIAAKGLSGEGYEGHYFWDTEIYMLPYFILTQPEKARRILMYRYRHLNQSRLEARHLGCETGAKIPWRTINGDETSPYYPAGSAQVHINSDLAYSIDAYFNATNDLIFMSEAGFEMLLETGVFLLEYGHFKDNLFHLDSVTGPDEYTAIVNDNYYTNAMAKRHFEIILKFAKNQPVIASRVFKETGIGSEILHRFEAAAKQMNLIIDKEKKIIAQDAGFLFKKDLDLNQIPSENHPMLLHYHPLFIYRHQILKQSDSVLALVLLDSPRDKIYRNTFDYYLKRTTHDSSLSKCIYGIAAYGLGFDTMASMFFNDSLFIDLNDATKHTQHGLHMANIGGTFLLLAYGLMGIRLGEKLCVAPVKQKAFRDVRLDIVYQGVSVVMQIKGETLTIHVSEPLTICLYGKIVHVNDVTSVLIKSLD